VTQGASRTLEYAYDDWAVGVVAHVLHDETNATKYRTRSLNYVNVWDKDKEFMCPRTSDGKLHCSLESAWYFVDKEYTEGNAWQWTWFVPGDPLGLVALFGADAFNKKLDECMFRSTLHPSNALPNPYYWAGNEPDILHPWLFVFGGRPDLTQKWTRWVAQHKCHGVGCPCSALHRYNTKPDGIPGNDDYGTLSAWLVFSGVGIYPLAGTPLYLIGSPSAPALNISLPTGVLQIRTEGWTEKAVDLFACMRSDPPAGIRVACDVERPGSRCAGSQT